MSQTSLSTLRIATPGDVDLVVDIGVSTFNDTFAHLNRAEDMKAYLSTAYSASQIENELCDPFSTFLIAEVDNRAVGYAKLFRGEPETCISSRDSIEISRFYVSRDLHGRGIAQAMMDRLLAIANEESFETIWLGVWEHNERAKAFYRKQGFREVGSHVFQLGSDPQIDLVFERKI